MAPRLAPFWLQPVYLVIAAQLLFACIGIQVLHSFAIGWIEAAVAVGSAAFAELFFANVSVSGEQRKLFFPASAVATGLGFVLFMRAVSPWYFALASVLAVASKYLIRRRGSHIFNPSNFALTVLAFALPSAVTIEFTQWGTDARFYVLIAVVCLIVAYRSRALPITLSFGAAYTALLIPLVSLAPDRFTPHHYGLLGPSLVIFASFMITDPKTAPRTAARQIVHGAGIALLYFCLEIMGLRYALFAASFLTALLNAILGWLLSGKTQKTWMANVLTCTLSFFLFAGAAAYSVRPAMPFNPLRLSSSFLLFGIDGDGIKSCATHPLYSAAQHSGLESAEMTEGAAWGDYDADGYDDLFVSNINGSKLYRNNRDGTFTDVTKHVGLPVLAATAAVFVDYDNNGTLDLIVSAANRDSATSIIYYSRPRVFKNTGGKFVDATVEAGLSGVPPFLGSGHLSFGDYDNDGRLDFVFTSTGLIWDPIDSRAQQAFERTQRDTFYNGALSTSVVCGDPGVSALVGRFPSIFSAADRSLLLDRVLPLSTHLCIFYSGRIVLLPGMTTASDQPPILRYVQVPGRVEVFRNLGSSFTRAGNTESMADEAIAASATSSLYSQNERASFLSGRFYQPVSFDYDGDGQQDIFIATDFGRDLLLKNRGGFTFSDETHAANMDYFSSGMGADVADYDGDGRPDVVVTNVPQDYLFRNLGGTFENEYKKVPIAKNGPGWGIAFVDVNGDGRDDIYVTNGLAEAYSPDKTPAMAATRRLFLTDDIFENGGDGEFRDVTGDDICTPPKSGKTVAVDDFDNDGDPDIFTGSEGTGNTLWVNTSDMHEAHYLAIALRGTVSNRMGVGAAVTVNSNGHSQTKFLLAGGGFGSQNSAHLLFGLGNVSGPVNVEVRWPSGRVTNDRVGTVDRSVVITEH